MARSKAQQHATQKWNDAHMTEMYERITMLAPKGRKQLIEERAKAVSNGTLSGYLNMLVRTDLGFSEEDWRKMK